MSGHCPAMTRILVALGLVATITIAWKLSRPSDVWSSGEVSDPLEPPVLGRQHDGKTETVRRLRELGVCS